MTESSPILSRENLNTIVAVAFVLGLFALSMNLWNYTNTNQLLNGMLSLQQAADAKTTALVGRVDALEQGAARTEALERRIAELEAKVTAAAAAAPATTAAP